MPIHQAVVHTASLYVGQNSNGNPTTTASSSKANADMAANYLAKADTAAQAQAVADPNYITGMRYIDYRLMRATTIGTLARSLGDPYTKQYRGEYDAYIALAMQSPNVLAKDNLPFARLVYASDLHRNDKDDAAAKAQLDLLAQELQALQNPDVSGFVRFLRNTSRNYPLVKTGPL